MELCDLSRKLAFAFRVIKDLLIKVLAIMPNNPAMAIDGRDLPVDASLLTISFARLEPRSGLTA